MAETLKRAEKRSGMTSNELYKLIAKKYLWSSGVCIDGPGIWSPSKPRPKPRLDIHDDCEGSLWPTKAA